MVGDCVEFVVLLIRPVWLGDKSGHSTSVERGRTAGWGFGPEYLNGENRRICDGGCGRSGISASVCNDDDFNIRKLFLRESRAGNTPPISAPSHPWAAGESLGGLGFNKTSKVDRADPQ